MANKKSRRAPGEIANQVARTQRNKERKAKAFIAFCDKAQFRIEKRLAKKHAKRKAHYNDPNYKPGPNVKEPKVTNEFTVILKEGGKRFHGLAILESSDTKRDAKGKYEHAATVTFVTPQGKKWHMQVHELSFVINPMF